MEKPANYYVDNEKLYAEFVKYKQKCRENEAAGKERPRLPDSIGKAILDIAENYSKKRNFYFLPYREEMVSDAIITCVKYAHNFDETKYFKPFAYLTLIIHRAFLQRIAKEKKDNQGKKKYIKHVAQSGMLIGPDGLPEGHNYVEYMQKYLETIERDSQLFDDKNTSSKEDSE